jgi:hypothetical protein
MNLLTKKSKANLKTDVQQKFKIPLDFGGHPYTIMGIYEYRRDTKELDIESLAIGIPGFPEYTRRSGLYADFRNHYDREKGSGTISGGHRAQSRAELKKLFKEHVQPVLEEKLPKYITRLLNFDD